MRFSAGTIQFKHSAFLLVMFLISAVSLVAQQKPLPVRDADAVCAKCDLDIY